MEQQGNRSDDPYVHGMDWQGHDQLKGIELKNYRNYQHDLLSGYIGKHVLEVGSGDRSFTKLIELKNPGVERLHSIEPSETLMRLHENKYAFPPEFTFEQLDLFDLSPGRHGLFDTIIMVHVLEHIEDDRAALDHLHTLLKPGGRLLIEVPALQLLFSIHDQALGHHRRYNKKSIRMAIDDRKYTIQRLWYQEVIGVLGSLVYFKFKKTNIKSDLGAKLVVDQGQFFDKYVIPFEAFIERFLSPPFGLSLSAVLERK